MDHRRHVGEWARRQGARVQGRTAVLRDQALRRWFPVLERLGVHAVPRHWFEPIPDRDSLTDAVFQHRSALVGVDLRLGAQVELLEALAACYGPEFARFPRTAAEAAPGSFYVDNGTFESIDAEIAYALVRWLRPERLVEVGLGYSTLLLDLALRRNELDGARCRHVGVDPWPAEVAAGIEGLELVRQPVEQVPLDLFTGLEAGDVVFIDSSHSVRTGGDVVHEHLEVLPRLAPGVVVHFHDIFLPGEYPQRWLLDHLWFPTEQYLLAAFLAHNDAFEVLWSGAAMATSHPVELARAIPAPRTAVAPGSFWIRRLGCDAPALPRPDP